MWIEYIISILESDYLYGAMIEGDQESIDKFYENMPEEI